MDKHQQRAQQLGPEEQFASAMLVLLTKYAQTTSPKRRANLEHDLLHIAACKLRVREEEANPGKTVTRLVLTFEDEES